MQQVLPHREEPLLDGNAHSVRYGEMIHDGEALLYVFEDNEAVIKMIIKGRSPTMRHVSRTHRVASDRLFDRINLDNLQTFWRKEVMYERNRSTFSICRTLWKTDFTQEQSTWKQDKRSDKEDILVNKNNRLKARTWQANWNRGKVQVGVYIRQFTGNKNRIQAQIKVKKNVFADSVLCLGKMKEPAEAIERWTGQLKDLNSTVSIQEFYGIDGVPTEFE